LRNAFRGSGGEELAVAHDGEAVGEGFCERALVGDHDDGHAELRLEFAEKVRMASPVAESRLPVARRREGFGAIDESAGDGDALLFAAGKFRGAMPRRWVRRTRSRASRTRRGARRVDFSEAKREFDVFLEVMRGEG